MYKVKLGGVKRAGFAGGLLAVGDQGGGLRVGQVWPARRLFPKILWVWAFYIWKGPQIRIADLNVIHDRAGS